MIPAERPATKADRVREPLIARAILALVQFGVRHASRIAPRFVERRAADLFSSPRRLRRKAVRGPEPARIACGRWSLASWVEGPKDAPLILLVHGWESDSQEMKPFIAPLRSAGYRVAWFDQPAHGLSTGRRANVVDFRDAVTQVVGSLGPVHGVIGHSLGATATSLALATGLRARRVALLAPAREPGRFVARIADLLGLPPARRAGMLSCVKRDIGPFEALDVALCAPSFSTHALIIHARNDRTIPFEDGASIAAAWPGAQLLAPEKLGHKRLLGDVGVVEAAVRFVTQDSAIPREVATTQGARS